MTPFFIFLATVLLCWACWFYTLFTIDPFASGWLGILFFYLSLFLASGGTFVFASFFLRRKINPQELPGSLIKVSLRQGFFLAFILAGSLYLLSKNMLRWWNGSLFILIIIIIEAFFQLKKRTRVKPQRMEDNNLSSPS